MFCFLSYPHSCYLLFYTSQFYFSLFSHLTGIDIIHQLGLTGRREEHLSGTTELTSSPWYHHSPLDALPPGVGVTLSGEAHIEAPVLAVLTADIGVEFSVIVNLSVRRTTNNAFLFSIRNSQDDRLRFGIQLLPESVVVHVGEEAIHFAHTMMDERWHSFAIGVSLRSVSFYADCGSVWYTEEIPAGSSQGPLASDGLFALGRLNSTSPQLEGALCQLDIYPSAQAAAQYCDYVKKQCRLADTFRSPPPTESIHGSGAGALDAPTQTSLGIFSDPSPAPLEPLWQGSSSTPLPDTTTTSTTINSPSLENPAQTFLNLNPSGQQESGVHHAERTLSVQRFSPSSSPRPLSRIVLEATAVAGASRTTKASTSGGSATTITATSSSSATDTGKAVLQGENDTEDERLNRTRHPTSTATPALISPVRQSRLKEGQRNWTRSGLQPQSDNELMSTQLRPNGTTLYRDPGAHNQVDDSEEYPLEAPYDTGDADTYGYDYGYEEGDYFFEYDGLNGPKGEPGPPVSLLPIFFPFLFSLLIMLLCLHQFCGSFKVFQTSASQCNKTVHGKRVKRQSSAIQANL